MSSVKLSLISALAAVALVSTSLYWKRHDRRAEAQQLRIANATLRREAVLEQQPVVQAAGEPDARVQKPEGAQTLTSRGPGADVATADYRFQGQATPVDTLQTMAWALDRGDVELMMNVITFDEPARAKFEAYWASLPGESRAQWPTADALAATLLVNRGINQPYPRAHLLERATVEPVVTGRVMLRLPGTPKDREVYQKVGDDWKWVITESLVDAYLRQVAERARP